LTREQLSQAGSLPLGLLIANNSIGELAVYINGVESGHTRGMTATPAPYWTHPFTTEISHPSADGSVVLAVRGWISSSVASGPLSSVQIGPPQQMQDKLELTGNRLWNKYVLSLLLSTLLYFCVALLGAILYFAQRHHSEYLWLALLCVTLAIRGVIEIGGLLEGLSTPLAFVLDNWIFCIFMAVTLEFVLRFTASQRRIPVRALQIAVLLIPVVALLNFQQAYDNLFLIVQVLFCVLVVAMLFRGWRRDRPEAGVMLLPFLLTAMGNSSAALLHYAADKNWIPAHYAIDRIYIGPIGFGLGFFTYQIFMASLLAVILYRFVHVSQEEQRSSAEIEAARSVQAMLIPTRLPSNKVFSLDSAYLPINGVGGDFFQALPLQDGSMLIVVGDVSGKGLQAAMNASSLVGALRNELSHDPATILAHLNQVMLGVSSGPTASFATCLCTRIYPNGKMIIANAGHLSPYRDGREMELAPDLPLGVIPNIAYEQATFQLQHGDRLIFLSDGVVEAANPKGELFGFERTQQVSHEPARYIAQIAQRFGQTDDITVVSLYFVPA
jgi:hypothetical protein